MGRLPAGEPQLPSIAHHKHVDDKHVRMTRTIAREVYAPLITLNRTLTIRH
jgi:hypothetical protein